MSADANPALQQLGQRLSQAREACGLSLEEHADRLNMGHEQLQALEAGNREGLPEPVFVIAQARRVATSLGIQIDEEIAALRSSDGFQTPRAPRAAAAAQSQNQNQEPPAAARPPARIERSNRAGKAPTALPVPLLGLLALLAAAAALIGLQRGLSRRATVPTVPQSAPTTSTAGSEAAEEPGTPASESGAANPSRNELVLQPTEPSWVEVRSADGTTLFRGTLERQQRFPLEAGLEVLAGRPDLVQVRLGPSPAGPMGSIEDVRWRRFRPDPAPAP
ncbi:MAG: RodZ domain-containing protein [Synechococcaceae cyanobacterium]